MGRVALRKVAVNRDGTLVAAPAVPPTVAAAPPPEPELALPEWMRSASDPAPVIPVLSTAPAVIGSALAALLAKIEAGEGVTGPLLASLFRLLVERGVLDQASVVEALEKL